MSASMLEYEIPMPEGWESAWIERSYRPLRYYYIITSYVLSLTVFGIAFANSILNRRIARELAATPSNSYAIKKRLNRSTLKFTRGNFVVACVYLLSVIGIAMTDAIIAAEALSQDVKENPEVWDSDLLFEIAAYTGYIFVLFAATYFLVPLLQLLAVTWYLARFSIKNGSNALADYVPVARAFSTGFAQIWSIILFALMVGWPADSDSIWRFVAIQACYGSALTWLDASFMFNFRSEKLEELHITDKGLRGVLAMFCKTVKAAHTKTKLEKLPKYEEIAQDLPQDLMIGTEKEAN